MQLSFLHPRYWPAWAGLFFLRLIELLPFTYHQAIGRGLGRIMSKKLKRRRHNAEVNIDICFPALSSKEKADLVDANMISTGLGVIETCFSWWASDQQILKRCRIEGLELLDQAKSEGRGVLLIGAHYTTLDLAGRIIGLHADLDITYKRQKNEVFDYYINKVREKSFKNLIEKGQVRTMIKSLKNGRTIWFAPDQDFGRRGAVFAPFFGRLAATISSVGKLLRVTNAKPLFYSMFREVEDGKVVYVARVFDPFNDGFGDDDMENAILLNTAIEDVIMTHPEQYLWVHERFRTQPVRSMPKPYSIRKKKKRK